MLQACAQTVLSEVVHSSTMQRLVLFALLAPLAEAFALRAHSGMGQEPDTACGKGFESLVQGSKDYYGTAMVKLFTHPWHTMDNATFEREYQCWFANMCTSKCGDMKPVADRKKDLAKQCTSTDYDWLKIWKFFSDDEIKWFKKAYPSEEVESEDTDGEAGEKPVMYKAAMDVVKTINKKELLCLTLFTIDDECVKYNHIRMD